MTSLYDEYDGGGILGVEDLKNAGKQAKIPQTRKEKLQAELQLLEWHKMANNAAIKGALLQTKNIREQSAKASIKAPNHVQEDSKWIKRVIQEEHIKPLNVSKDFVLNYEQNQQEINERLSNQVDRHIETLKTLRLKLEAKHDMMQRKDEYKQWQKSFLPKKHAVMIGKTLAEVEKQSTPTTRDDDGEIDEELLQKYQQRQQSKTQAGGNTNSANELSTVLESLSKLADLEQRISSLEKENRYEELTAKEHPTAQQRTSIEFKKKRVVLGSGNSAATAISSTGNGQQPVGMRYEINVGNKPNKQQRTFDKNWSVTGVRGALAIKNNKPGAANGYDTEDAHDTEYEQDEDSVARGPGVFITAQASTDRLRSEKELARKEKMRQWATAPAGQKQLKQRVQLKKMRVKEQQQGNRKHEEAMREMHRRKQEQHKSNRKDNNPNISNKAKAPARGIAAGVRTKNKHLQEFEKLKSGYKKRQESVNKKFTGTAPSASRAAPVTNRGNSVEQRMISQTAPAYTRPVHPLTVRKTTVNANNANANAKGGAVAVRGISGLRALKNNKVAGSTPQSSSINANNNVKLVISGIGGAGRR